MSTLTEVRSELATALGAVSGLSSYETVPGQVSTPAAVIAPDGIDFHADFDGGATYRLPVQFLVAIGDWGTAQRLMDGFVAHDGTAATAIDGITSIETRVVAMEDYGLTSFANTDYLGARLIVEVIV